jgi:hypothetical protein
MRYWGLPVINKFLVVRQLYFCCGFVLIRRVNPHLVASPSQQADVVTSPFELTGMIVYLRNVPSEPGQKSADLSMR